MDVQGLDLPVIDIALVKIMSCSNWAFAQLGCNWSLKLELGWNER